MGRWLLMYPVIPLGGWDAARAALPALTGQSSRPAIPTHWRIRESRIDGQLCEGRALRRDLRVIWSEAIEDDGRSWRHVSISARSAPLPTWEELEWVRTRFIGDRFAYQVHAPADEHVNLSEVLHLWACMDGPTGRVLPDFTQGGRSI